MENVNGLSEDEALRRQSAEGFNELPSSKPKSMFGIAWAVVREPMFLMLVACGGIYLLLGDPEEASMLLGFVFVIIGITFYQERKTERALEALRDLSSPRALVVRDGKERRIPGREVVRGDLLVLTEGDRVPADGRLIESNYLAMDESLLTGESVPVPKAPGGPEAGPIRPGDNNPSSLFSGTLVVQGRGLAIAEATGTRTALGQIGATLDSLEPETTRLHRETARLVRNLVIVGAFLFVTVVLAYGWTRGEWLPGLLAGITMAMAILPEEFPVVLTVFLALGAWRIARHHVLTREMPALETLGSVTVLCVDKTGTLTQNRMRVERLVARGQVCRLDLDTVQPIPEPFHETVEFSILASRVDPFDPMEKAFRSLGDHFLAGTEHLHRDWTLVREYPLSRELLAVSQVWESSDVPGYVVAAKGAPEAIMDLCHLSDEARSDVTQQVSAMARDGLRVLAAAKAHMPARTPSGDHPDTMPDQQHDFDFEFLGLLGLSDPVRPTVPQAIRECQEAGIRVAMITGDYPETATNIARQIGLDHSENVLTGPELDAMDDSALRERLRTTSVFARMVPEQKLRLVEALKANGEITAMTGDGVNDAPALRAAHIGIAMGERGTDVAREAADLVLLDDDFTSIVRAVRLGRRIFANLQKAMAYILAIHVPIAGMSLLPVLLRWPLVLLPLHVVFLELIIDPACSVVFEAEPEEEGVMRRPPRAPDEPLFGRRLVLLSLLQGITVFLLVLSVFAFSWYREHGELEARALAYTTLIVGNLALILVNRSWSETIWSSLRRRNNALVVVIGGALASLAAVLYISSLRNLFGFGYLHVGDILYAVSAGVIGVLWFEAFKILHRLRRGWSA